MHAKAHRNAPMAPCDSKCGAKAGPSAVREARRTESPHSTMARPVRDGASVAAAWTMVQSDARGETRIEAAGAASPKKISCESREKRPVDVVDTHQSNFNAGKDLRRGRA